MIPTLLPIILLLPLVGFLINGLLGSRIKSEKVVGAIGTAMIAIPFALAVFVLVELVGAPVEERTIHVRLLEWIAAGNFSVDFAYMVDPLSMVFLLIITGVGSLIHIYSIGYMHGDRGFARFFAYLNLFIFMMLNLVLADNYLVTFLGWEGVGLCSYLLIGFWYDQEFEGVGIHWTGDAAKKAFVMNRIGDLGMLVGMFILFWQFGTLQYSGVEAAVAQGVSSSKETLITIATLALFLGACGKSAQLPLSVWLPDAMAGPTPVSALIHAATMVTAGIFLVARNATLFSMSHTTMTVVTVVAAATALIAATIGIVQNDIKKVLAYSTVSQLGFMFIALGVGAWTTAVFHVMTHAFFKALLFLGSGSVIHGMHHEQNMQKMGGLKSHMPSTYRTYVIGALAISGIPIFSGFFSKDEILLNAFVNGGPILWGIGAVAAFCTAFYMFRSVHLTFDGTERFDTHHTHPHEVGLMTAPLWVLAFLSVFGGFLGLPALLGEHVNILESWLEPVFATANANLHHGHPGATLEMVLMGVSIGVALSAIVLARYVYIKHPEVAVRTATRFKSIHALLWNKWYIDNIYETLVVGPTTWLSRAFLLRVVDQGMIDGTLNGSGRLTAALGATIRRMQTGVAQNYAAVVVAGIVVMLAFILLR